MILSISIWNSVGWSKLRTLAWMISSKMNWENIMSHKCWFQASSWTDSIGLELKYPWVLRLYLCNMYLSTDLYASLWFELWKKGTLKRFVYLHEVLYSQWIILLSPKTSYQCASYHTLRKNEKKREKERGRNTWKVLELYLIHPALYFSCSALYFGCSGLLNPPCSVL